MWARVCVQLVVKNVRAEFMQTCVTGRFEVEKSDARSSW